MALLRAFGGPCRAAAQRRHGVTAHGRQPGHLRHSRWCGRLRAHPRQRRGTRRLRGSGAQRGGRGTAGLAAASRAGCASDAGPLRYGSRVRVATATQRMSPTRSDLTVAQGARTLLSVSLRHEPRCRSGRRRRPMCVQIDRENAGFMHAAQVRARSSPTCRLARRGRARGRCTASSRHLRRLLATHAHARDEPACTWAVIALANQRLDNHDRIVRLDCSEAKRK